MSTVSPIFQTNCSSGNLSLWCQNATTPNSDSAASIVYCLVVFETIFWIILGLFALIFNVLAVTTIAKTPTLNNTYHYLLCSIFGSDLTIAVITLPAVIWDLHGKFDPDLEKLINFTSRLTLIAGLNSIVCVAYERYQRVKSMTDLDDDQGFTFAIRSISIAWLFAVIPAMMDSFLAKYKLTFVMIILDIPLANFMYLIVIRKLKRDVYPFVVEMQRQQQLKRLKDSIAMMYCIIIGTVILWCFGLFFQIPDSVFTGRYVLKWAITFMGKFILSRSVLDPLIYFWWNKSSRECTKRLLAEYVCKRNSTEEDQ